MSSASERLCAEKQVRVRACELGMSPEAARGAGWWAAGGTMLPHGDELEDDIAQHQQDHNDLRVQAQTGKGHDKKRWRAKKRW